MMSSYEDFEKEYEEVLKLAKEALKKILLSKDRMEKHAPYSWKDEQQDEHFHKAIRHILTYMIQRDGQQMDDNEDHLALAITRLCMAVCVEDRAAEIIGRSLAEIRGYEYLSK